MINSDDLFKKIKTDQITFEELDAADELASFRAQFVIEDPDLIYLDGNSLGRLPKKTKELAQEIVSEQWGSRLIRSWNERWLEDTVRIGDKVGVVVGAKPGEVVLADSTTVCLFKAAVSALLSKPTRSVILTDDQNFPSDIQALKAAASTVSRDHKVVVIESNGLEAPVEALLGAIDETVALVSLSQVSYRSGCCWDLSTITQKAHQVGAKVLWDLSHSVGVVPIDLRKDEIDLAIGCTYKYLNGGPGAPAFIYISENCHDLINPIAGWYGSRDPFGFDPDSQPQNDNRRFLTGTPPLVSTLLIEPGVDLVIEAGVNNIRSKSVALSERFLFKAEKELLPLGFSVASPVEHKKRGSHLSFSHDSAKAIGQALINEQATIPDVRPPDLVRFGFAPLYTTFGEIEESIDRVKEVISGGGISRWKDAMPVVP
ncbi:MAG: kynureninase [Acidimicrobiales bacterium]|nr:kynureninase [Acidimicrobiales bacterium]